jgi:hypothetical protein
MIQLTYISSATPSNAGDEIERILRIARSKNASQQVAGCNTPTELGHGC